MSVFLSDLDKKKSKAILKKFNAKQNNYIKKVHKSVQDFYNQIIHFVFPFRIIFFFFVPDLKATIL